jgi:PTH1 family peptidyl-tRNA hydrolase
VAVFKDIFSFFRRRCRRPQPSTLSPALLDTGYIVFGIGNTGSKYANTRHNVGFAVADQCLGRCEDVRRNTTESAAIATGRFAGHNVAFVKPITFVNRCGTALKASFEELGVPLGSCLVIVDDYNLPLGTLRFRKEGSDGGHNGLKSIINAVGREFPRLRVGIGPLSKDMSPVDFVLGAFTREEGEILSPTIDKAVEGIAVFLNDGIDKAMSAFNGPRKEQRV